ncbi:hypothetical protein FJTKL_00314 [Diaporthe vaccinii]|uniref:Uncharacterized protein n=1 Tax=Diaporthe vaccinii TaxID=105482 RepID=A0ABR4E3M3_9PEZI
MHPGILASYSAPLVLRVCRSLSLCAEQVDLLPRGTFSLHLWHVVNSICNPESINPLTRFGGWFPVVDAIPRPARFVSCILLVTCVAIVLIESSRACRLAVGLLQRCPANQPHFPQPHHTRSPLFRQHSQSSWPAEHNRKVHPRQ